MKLSQAGDREGKTGGGTSIGIITDTEEEASGGRLAALGLGAAGEEGGFMGGGDTVCSLPGERDLGKGERCGPGLVCGSFKVNEQWWGIHLNKIKKTYIYINTAINVEILCHK